MMSVRERFELDIKAVQEQLFELCEASISALEKAFVSLKERNVDLALSVIENDKKINLMEEMINDRIILLIAKQQPVARDLRHLMVILKAAADMERVADYAVNIAKDAIRISNEPQTFPLTNLETMWTKSLEMLRNIVEAFMSSDTIAAKEIADLDDYIDDLYGATVELLLRTGGERPEAIKEITHLSFVCRYLERTADHATNIAEHLFYLVKGIHYDLND